MDKKFVITGLIYAILGMSLGIYMAATGKHGQFVTHAHILLAGFVVSFIYGLSHKLWLNNPTGALAQVQFYLHQIGIFFMSLGLFLLYGGFIALEKIDPVLAFSSLAVLSGMVLMAVMFLKTCKSAA